MSEKSPDAFRTISEIAEELDLPQHVLRFWETKFSQIRPTKRSSGRRFYRPDDIALIRTIRDLLYRDGYTIRGVQQLLREHGAKAIVADPSSPASAISRQSEQAQSDALIASPSVEESGGLVRTAENGLSVPKSALEQDLRGCAAMLRAARTQS